MDLSTIKAKIKRKKTKRLGRGIGSGKGKTSGRGHKGAGQRAGKKLPYIGFRGGNLAYFRKIPKRGFTSPYVNEYQIVNLRDIEKIMKDIKEINSKTLKEFNLIKDENKPVKILGDIKEKLSLKANFKVNKFSLRAEELIEKAGGKAEWIEEKEKKRKKKKKAEIKSSED